jgi:hypothetical protein
MRIPLLHKEHRALRFVPLAAAVVFASACSMDLVIPDYNNPSIEDLTGNPTPTKIATAAQGLLIGTRVQQAEQNGYVSLLGILGRESYNFDPADPRFVTEMLIGPLDPGSPAFGANLFAFPYRNIRNANILLGAVDAVAGLTTAQKEAVKGFAKTIEALDYLYIINTRDDLGAPLDVNISATDAPAPFVSKTEIFNNIVRLLDEGLAHLQAGGGAFPFTLSPGFAGFDTPATFAQLNRALKARVEVYRTGYAAALSALGQSFISTSAPLTLGAYHSYSTGSGDIQNRLFDPTGRAILAHPALVTDAQTQPSGAPDARLTAKVGAITPRTVQGVTAGNVFTIYTSNTAGIPIIRNEELILLRSEARWFTGDKAGAMADLNFIRTTSGGLAPIATPATDAAFRTALLYERRYSLMFEGGHRWIDMRRVGLLSSLPKALPTHTVASRFPFPEGECLARLPDKPAGCP